MIEDQETFIGKIVFDQILSEEPIILPEITALRGNFPNPFNPTTTIMFDLEKESDIRIEIFNIRGQRVRLLAKGVWAQGSHSIEWNGTNDDGRAVGSGVYFYQMRAGEFVETRRMLLLK